MFNHLAFSFALISVGHSYGESSRSKCLLRHLNENSTESKVVSYSPKSITFAKKAKKSLAEMRRSNPKVYKKYTSLMEDIKTKGLVWIRKNNMVSRQDKYVKGHSGNLRSIRVNSEFRIYYYEGNNGDLTIEDVNKWRYHQ